MWILKFVCKFLFTKKLTIIKKRITTIFKFSSILFTFQLGKITFIWIKSSILLNIFVFLFTNIKIIKIVLQWLMFTSLPKRNDKSFMWKFVNRITNKIFVRAWRFPQGRTPLTARTRTDIYYLHTYPSFFYIP